MPRCTKESDGNADAAGSPPIDGATPRTPPLLPSSRCCGSKAVPSSQPVGGAAAAVGATGPPPPAPPGVSSASSSDSWRASPRHDVVLPPPPSLPAPAGGGGEAVGTTVADGVITPAQAGGAKINVPKALYLLTHAITCCRGSVIRAGSVPPAVIKLRRHGGRAGGWQSCTVRAFGWHVSSTEPKNALHKKVTAHSAWRRQHNLLRRIRRCA